MKERAEPRRSGIELLRILAACMVVFSHLSGWFFSSKVETAMPISNTLITNLLLSISTCAVDIFIIISGSFLWNRKERSLGKAINLLVLMAVINMSSYLTQVFRGALSFQIIELLRYCFSPSYFVTLYIVLYLVSPYINCILEKLTPRGWSFFIVITFTIFSFYGIAADVINECSERAVIGISPFSRTGSQNGYNIVNFILLYCIGAFLNARRQWLKQFSSIMITVVLILCIFAIYGWSTIGPYLANYGNSARSYHNPFVILLAMSLFLVFERKVFYNRMINSLAKAAFTVFLIHQHLFSFLHVGFHIQLKPALFLLWIIASIMLIYLGSWLFWRVYDYASSWFYRRINRYIIPYGLDDIDE